MKEVRFDTLATCRVPITNPTLGCVVKHTSCSDDGTSFSPTKLWYSKEELHSIRHREQRLSEKITILERQGRRATIHGLQSSEKRKRRRSIVRRGQLLVLMLQEELWDTCEEVDPEELAMHYTSYAKKYSEIAHVKAVLDEVVSGFGEQHSASSSCYEDRSRVSSQRGERLLVRHQELCSTNSRTSKDTIRV